jgi:ion channel-forming bestrophin family protein
LNILSMSSSRILRDVSGPTAFLAGISTYVCVGYPGLAGAVSLPEWAQYFPASADTLPLTLTGPILALLLVFRTENSYKRFDEARKMWGLMLNRTRDIVREAIAFFPDGSAEGESSSEGEASSAGEASALLAMWHTKATFARWTIAFTLALRCHCRADEDLRTEVEGLLTEDEAAAVLSSEHRVRIPSSTAMMPCPLRSRRRHEKL